MIYATSLLVIANIALVIVAALQFCTIKEQAKTMKEQAKKSDTHIRIIANHFKLAMLTQKRYQVEGDITQLRIKRAELLEKAGGKTKNGKSPMNIIDYRECEQCKPTIDETVKEIEECKKVLKELEERI